MQARDSFFECVEAAGVSFTVEAPVPAKCKEARAAYEAACKASWVKHFDLLQVCRCSGTPASELQTCDIVSSWLPNSCSWSVCAVWWVPTRLTSVFAGQAAALLANFALKHCQADSDRHWCTARQACGIAGGKTSHLAAAFQPSQQPVCALDSSPQNEQIRRARPPSV
jgi:hypothetical protein